MVTVEEVAQRLNLKPQHANGKTEYHGANPRGEGATSDGFILFAEGNAIDRKAGHNYTSAEVARMADIDHDEYAPVREWRGQQNRNGHAPNPTNAPRRSTHAALKPPKFLDKRPLEERGITPTTFAEFEIRKISDEQSGTWYEYPTFHPDGTRGRSRRKFQEPDRAGTPEKPKKNDWLKRGGEGIPVGYGIERIKPGEEVWLVNSEVSVWHCNQEGIGAICPLGEGRNLRPMLEAIKQRGATSLRVVLDNDTTGRNATEKAIAAAHELGLTVTSHQSPQGSKDGYDAADLWEECQRDGRDFRAAVEALPEYLSSVIQQAPAEKHFALTDTGNAERFVAQHGESVRYCMTWKRWLVWDRRWKPDEKNTVQQFSKETIRSIPSEIAHITDETRRVEILRHAARSENHARRVALLALAESERDIAVTAEELDADFWLFNVQNGTIDLRTGQLKPHNRADLLTKIAPVVYDSQAQCPIFLAYLEAIFRGRKELINFLRRVIGYTLTGDIREQIFLVLHGRGSNGKSILLCILLELFGDYGHTMEPATISAKQNEKMATDIAELFGKRFVACSETNEGRRLDEAMIKRATGGEQLTGERKYERAFTFKPQFQIFFGTNHMPEIRGSDRGIWRRIHKIPFDETFWDGDKGETGAPELRADKDLLNKLRRELPGILSWAVAGCLEWQRNGLGTPEEVTAATEAYREEQDLLAAFLNDCCIRTNDARAKASELYGKYCNWCEASHEPTISQKRFGNQLAERGFKKGREAGTGKAVWFGIGLIDEASGV